MKISNKTVESPCIRNCCLDQQDICVGCYRSLSEILAWGGADPEQKLAILAQVEKRKNQQNNTSNNRS